MSHVTLASASAGLDIVHPFDLAAWKPELLGAPPPFAAGKLGILIGNTRRLWPVFTAACRDTPGLAALPHPLDHYVTEQLTRVAAECTRRHAQLILAHVTAPRAFPIQRLAELTGLASLSPSHLAIHPVHGPWFALRAVLSFDVDGPGTPPPAPAHPCASCSAPCVPALERALAVSGSPLSSAAIAEHAREWIAVRDACPLGRASRYDDAQLSYHYAPSSFRLVQGS